MPDTTELPGVTLRRYARALAALQAAQLSRRAYELGLTDLATAILAQQQYGGMASSYFDCAVTYQSNWADLEKSLGLPLKL